MVDVRICFLGIIKVFFKLSHSIYLLMSIADSGNSFFLISIKESVLIEYWIVRMK